MDMHLLSVSALLSGKAMKRRCRAVLQIEGTLVKVLLTGGPYTGRFEEADILQAPGERLYDAVRRAAAKAYERIKAKYDLPDLEDPWFAQPPE